MALSVRLVTVAALLAALLLAPGAEDGFAGVDRGLPSKEAPPDQPGQIPLHAIYSTNGQDGLRPMNPGFLLEEDGTRKYVEPYGLFLDEMHSQFRAGGPNVLLVRGKDITAAVRATWLAHLGSRPFDRPVDPEDGTEGAPLWLGVYFGTTGSEPPAWLVEGARREESAIRLSYVKPQWPRRTKDLHQYFAWVPLGRLEAGDYALELFDAAKRQVTLLRRVSVAQSK